jgi:hypothetical protein
MSYGDKLPVLLLTALFMVAAQSATTTATSQTASIGLKSTRDKGIVSIMTDPVLAGGRLVLKVVALNQTPQPAPLRAEDVHVFTAAGRPVPVMTLDALIAEARGERHSGNTAMHQSSNYSRPQTSTSRTGEMDVSGITGASNPIGGTLAEQKVRRSGDAEDSPAVREQVEALRAGILQTVSVEPGKATGGQLVTEEIKFSRKEEKVLRVVVDFNGEQHEFNFEAPPAR